MTQTVYSCAFKSVVNEVKNSNPQVLSMFVFDNEGQLLAQDDSAKEQTIQEVMSASTAIIDNSVSIGNLECISVSASSNQVSLICAGNFCFMTVYQKGGDEKFLKSLIQTLVPIVIKLTDQLSPINQETKPKNDDAPKIEVNLPLEKTASLGAALDQQPETFLASDESESLFLETPVNQFMVEKLSGLLAPSDVVRIDNTVIAHWNELYGKNKIQTVNIETLRMKTTQCKFKPIKDAKLAGKGIIQIPEKILLTLDASKDDLVMVKPVVQSNGEKT